MPRGRWKRGEKQAFDHEHQSECYEELAHFRPTPARSRLPRYRQRLIDDLGLTNEQVDELIAGGVNYRQHYDRGVYGYRLLVIGREADPSPRR